MTSSNHRTAILVDRHPLWLDAVEQVLARVDVEVAGKTSSLEDAGELIRELEPDMLVAEISLPGNGDRNAVSWVRELGQGFPDLKIVVLSTCDEPEEIDAALAAGAIAYVVKTAHPDDLAAAVRQAFEHSVYLPGMRLERPEPSPREAVGLAGLTRREVEILRLVAEGLSNGELAKMLWVTEQTVKFHLSNVYRKLNVSNRTEASRWAQVNGLLPPDGPSVTVAGRSPAAV